MLELLLTRREDRELVRATQGLRFLVFDELHTYRGRQGADVALLIRRCRLAFGGHDFVCAGTSATMASEGSSEEQKRAVAAVAQTLFGAAITVDQVIGETLERVTPEQDFADPAMIDALAAAVATDDEPPVDYDTFRVHPLALWIESAFGVRTESETGWLIRQPPGRFQGPGSAVASLAAIEPVTSASFPLPAAADVGDFSSGRLLHEVARLSIRAAAGPFRSFARIVVEPRPYQLVPLMMALKLAPVRLLIADDVGIGKTVEAALIARELLDRGEIQRLAVLCPPHLAEQWQQELAEKFHIEAELVLSSTIQRWSATCPLACRSSIGIAS